MRVDELQQYVGAEGVVTVNGFDIHVHILDVETRWGHAWLLVTPTAGDGERWMPECRVKK